MGKETERKRKKRTFIYLWILVALSVLLVAATYTWFSLSQTPHVNDLALYVNSEAGLELALAYDAPDEEWGQRLDFLDLVDEDYPLKPATWSQRLQTLVTVEYGFDGRTTGNWLELNDERNANRTDSDGYYVVGTFFARTGTPCSVSLAEAVEVNEGENGAGTYVIGTPKWDAVQLIHSDGGFGAETAIRMGFRVTPIDNTTGDPTGQSEFYIYEPNCNRHDGGQTGYTPTPSVDGAATLIDEGHLILQEGSTWSEAYPVQREVTLKELGNFIENKKLFSAETGEYVKIELYIWLEGQDVDCIAKIDKAEILASVQLHVDYTGQSGMDDIPEN